VSKTTLETIEVIKVIQQTVRCNPFILVEEADDGPSAPGFKALMCYLSICGDGVFTPNYVVIAYREQTFDCKADFKLAVETYINL